MRVNLPAEFLVRPIAHRAWHDLAKGRPENSLAAVRAAVAVGYGIEIDVQPSSDGVPMVFHDDDLERMTGIKGLIRERTAAELAELRLAGTGEKIPTLDEVLNAVSRRVPLLIEIKDQDGALGHKVGPLEVAVAQALRNYRDQVAVMSFNPYALMAVRHENRGLPLGLVTCTFKPEDWPGVPTERLDQLRRMEDWETNLIAAGFVSHEWTDLRAKQVAEIKMRGAKILAWTVRNMSEDRTARTVAHNVTFEGYAAPLLG